MKRKTTQNLLTMLVVGILLMFPATAQDNAPKKGMEKFLPEKNTPVIFSVDPQTNEIAEIFIKKSNTEQQLYDLKADCYRCEYYLGSLEGDYKKTSLKLIPAKETLLTVHTNKNLMPGAEYSPGEKFKPGSEFVLAGLKTIVVANKPGTFTVKTH